MKLSKKQIAFASLCVVAGADVKGHAEEKLGVGPGSEPVQAGIYAVAGGVEGEAITVTGDHSCTSRSSGQGTVFRSPFGTGIVCFSTQGFAYVNRSQPFAQSSLTQAIRRGSYGSTTPFASGRRQEIVVLPDRRKCVFNPTFDSAHIWTGESDDGQSNRVGLTIVGRHSDITCLSVSSADLAFFDPASGRSYLVTTPHGHNAFPSYSDLALGVTQQIIDAINPGDDLSYHPKHLPLAKKATSIYRESPRPQN
jgi:hypothetical protein